MRDNVRSSICEGREFISRLPGTNAQLKVEVNNLNQIYKCQLEPLLILAHSRLLQCPALLLQILLLAAVLV